MIAHSKELFAYLEKYEVKYVIIGGIAVILYGVPRMTGDIDLFIEATVENARRMLQVLQELGYQTTDLVTPEGLAAVKFLIFENGIKIDVMLKIPGLDFATAWSNKLIMHTGQQKFYLVSKADLITSKRAAGRPQDLEDVAMLIP
jgi:predicted nucleotidyltransferase